MDNDINNDPTSTCNKMIALSAVSEWILSIGWVAYMSTIAYDLYHIRTVVQLWQLKGDPQAFTGCISIVHQLKEHPMQTFLPHTSSCAWEKEK
jgi:hypothetical protein